MRILALNCGSSSIKCALIESETGRRLFEAHVENLGAADGELRIDAQRRSASGMNLEQALAVILDELQAASSRTGSVEAVAHRTVHGGERFTRPTVIDDAVVEELERLARLAPLHNPPSLAALRQARAALPDAAHVAVFDTSFHSKLPARAREYALPEDLRKQLGIRRFGFHGVSHEHVMHSAAAHMRTEPQQLRIISCHLGGGASIAAIEYGCSVETSMGMTPLEGLVMGTRAGDLDPGVIIELMHHGKTAEDIQQLLNKRSGLVGLAGTNDMRVIERRAAEGDEACRLAITLYAHRLRKYIGAYAAIMGGVDAIAFTGGIGENSALIRHRCVQRLEFLGAVLDEDRNRDVKLTAFAPVAEISDRHSRARLLVVRADEQHALVRAAAEPLNARARGPQSLKIPIAVSARHAHLSQRTVETLFGEGYQLKVRNPLSQPGQYAAQETVSLIGPRGRIDRVRVLGPPRASDQVELSRSDEFLLGVDAPVRISGDLSNTPGLTLEGPKGQVTLRSGVITARRHIHMHTDDAARLGVSDYQTVSVRVDTEGRDLVFGEVAVRVSPEFVLELHLDTDEANAAGLKTGDEGELVVGGG